MNQNQLYEPKVQKNVLNLRRTQRTHFYKNEQKMFICYDLQTNTLIALKSVNYCAKILPGLCIVQLEQVYSTESVNRPMDLEFIYVITENAAVTKMIIELGDIKVYGIIKEKEEAKTEYYEGLKQGKTMAYSEQDAQFPQIKRVKIGQLAQQKQLKISFEYIQPLDVFLNKFWKFDLSPMMDQNYVFQNEKNITGYHDEKIYKYLNRLFEIKSFAYAFKQDITVEIDFESPITFWKSPTHKLISQNEKNNDEVKKYEKKLILSLEDIPENYEPTKYFTLLFSTDQINLPRSIISHTKNDALQNQKYCATLTFIPKFNEVSLEDAYTQYLEGLGVAQNEKFKRGIYLFFIDRSGSMSGQRIRKAKESLILFLRSLPQDSEFNIISFGSEYNSMWKESQKYSQTTLEEAIRQIQKMDADMGGTEILNSLKALVYNKYNKKKNKKTLNVFLLTDGEADADPIIDLVKNNTDASTRVYTLGISQECSQYLIKRVAEVGNGKHQIVSDQEDINSKIIDLLEDSLTPYLYGFNLTSNTTQIAQIIPNPESIVCLKKNQELTIQILFPEQEEENIEFSIDCFDPQNNKQVKYSVKINLKQSQQNEYFHKLAAHKFITYYENSVNYGEQHVNFIKLNNENISDKDIVNLSVQHQILCANTAFVCEVCELEDQLKEQIKQKAVVNQANFIKPQFDNACYQSNAQYQNLSQSASIRLSQSYQRQEPAGCCGGGGGGQKNYQYQKNTQYYSPPKRNNSIHSQQTQQDNTQEDKSQDIVQKDALTYQYLLSFAQADGSFRIDDNTKNRINFKQLKNTQNLNEKIWVTFLVLLYLESFLKQYKSSWQLVYQKGIAYLKQQGFNYKLKRDEIQVNI